MLTDGYTASAEIPSVNFHLWKPCNMRCLFCFAAFDDDARSMPPPRYLDQSSATKIIRAIAAFGFRKINFAGGEPTLCPWIEELICSAHSLGMTTSIVTNGTGLTDVWLSKLRGKLDWVTLSIDSVNSATNAAIGRSVNGRPISISTYKELSSEILNAQCRLKLNTVVCSYNKKEVIAPFIVEMAPERWKVFQVLPVQGQNDRHIGSISVTREEFSHFQLKNSGVIDHGIEMVVEDNHHMTGSYIMIDPRGRFFDNVMGTHRYSSSILHDGVQSALSEIQADPARFMDRGGSYRFE